MRRVWKRLLTGILAMALVLTGVPMQQVGATKEQVSPKANKTTEPVVVVIDPGHDSRHTGASYFGAKEHELTLQIAKYFKEELETYDNVEVYLTRETNACPWGSVAVRTCLINRAKFAEEKDADIFVSIHLNADDGSGTVRGATVFYPNTSYNTAVSTEGKKVAQAIQNKLVALGIKDRGIDYKNAGEDTYADGSVGDYYRVIRECKERGIPGLIVEHAFLSSSSDYTNFLNSEEKLKKLGVADATAIAEYYGLSRKEEYEYGDATVTYAVNEEGNVYTVTAKGIPNAKEVRYAVWSKTGGQDDLKWYGATRNTNKEWVASVPLSNHNTSGLYYIHTYIVGLNGSVYKVAENTWTVAGDLSASVSVLNRNSVMGVFDVKVSDVYSPFGISSVQMQVWSKEDKSDLKGYTASKQSDGTYKIHVDAAYHDCNFGTYQVQTYITDNSGNKHHINTTTVSLPKPKTIVTPTLDENMTTASVSAWHVPGTYANSLKSVSFAVWSAKGGQDDLKWYAGKASADKFLVSIPLQNHNTTGLYYVHVYAKMANGTNQFVGSATFEVAEAQVSKVTIENRNSVSGVFDVVASGVKAVNGVGQVQMQVWSKDDKSDLKVYTASKQSDGTYKIHVDVASHDCNFGTYQVHTYVKNGYGTLEKVNEISVNIPTPKTIVNAPMDETQATVSLSAWHVPGTYGRSLKSVSFAVWSAKGGQDDLKWYAAKASADKFVYDLSTGNHKTTGTYYVHVYAQYANGTNKFVGSTTFEVSEAKAQKVEIQNLDTVAGTFDVVVSGAWAANGVQQVVVPIWSKSGQSDIKWYIASKQSDGTYKVHVDVATHDCNFGSYNIHTYVRNGFGQLEKVNETVAKVTSPETIITAIPDGMQENAFLSAENIPGTSGKSLKSVSFAVWSAKGGQDDLKWYTGKISDGKYVYTVSLDNHNTMGIYHVHVYANYSNGTRKFIGGTEFTIQEFTSIVGNSMVTASQLAAYYSANEKYPEFYSQSDAPNLDTFCQIYIEECAAEGIRAEVAFCQAMKETGFLRYLGDVRIEQYNFAGLDATGAILEDGSVDAGRSYASVREGIRAQVQRLKAWAVEGTTPSSYQYECVDADKFSSSWWVKTIVGSAPYVEWLGKQQNPSGYGWAVDPEYGFSIRDDYMAKLFSM